MKTKKSGKKIPAAAAVLVILVAVMLIIWMILPSVDAERKVSGDEISEGISILQMLSSKSVEDVEKQLDPYFKSKLLAYIDAGNFDAIYKNSIIMGDSHAEGFYVYNLLPQARVAATKGRDFVNCDEDWDKTVAANPEMVFVNYGLNGLQRTGGNVETYVAQYSEFLDKLQAALPDAEIIVCSIFQPKESVYASKPALASTPACNEALKVLCEGKGIKFIDTSVLLTDEYYEPDGIHTNAAYHKLWLKYAALESGLVHSY